MDNFFIKSDYVIRTDPTYYVEEPSDIIWQHHVYALAVYIARRLRCETIIDVGCGNGEKLRVFQGEFEFFGLDYGANLAYCRETHSFGTWIEVNLEDSDAYPQFSTDVLSKSVIICADVIEHLVDPTYLLETLVKWSMDAKAVILSTPERDMVHGFDDMGPPTNPHHVREWSLWELNQLLAHRSLPIKYMGLLLSNNYIRTPQSIIAIIGTDDWLGDAFSKFHRELGYFFPTAG
ncbi:MAG: hypothetical protein Q9P01_03195 [Anaerolineae bacterium]|nr:hypothetical protein [Anaerolineae bacterium]